MPNPNLPDTIDVANALLTYLQGVQYPSTTNFVYLQQSQLPATLQAQYPTGGVQHGKWKDASALLPPNSTNVIAEVHGAGDTTKRYTTGGRNKDYTNFYILSATDNTNSSAAYLRLYGVRDAIIPYLQQHSQLAGTGNLLLIKLAPGGAYREVKRGDIWFLCYICMVETISEWTTSTGFIS